MTLPRRRSIGAEVVAGGVDFRLWAPDHKSISLVLDGREVPLASEERGYFRGFVEGLGAGALYRFRIDGGDAFPDPASRFQPDGPHGPSMVVDPMTYRWQRNEWRGVQTGGLVIYEMHTGTFTREGTWRAAAEHLPDLAEIGINLLEVMPVGEFAGRFGWGYDGVDLWAPSHLYGSPDDFRAFIDAAHAAGLGVILDVVYNHFGPDGCYLREFTNHYFTSRYSNEWGEAINFDGPCSEGVREFVAENAAYWIDEFRLDGLRLDATQSIHDASPAHIVALVTRRAREAAGHRPIFLVAENEPQDVRLLHQYGVDAMWNDDWHHAAAVALTGRREAYYTDYLGTPQEFVSMAKSGFLYQGQHYAWQKNRRGTPSRDVPPQSLVCFLENHDQVANSAAGARLHKVTGRGRFRAMTALLLLGPNTPMLFQGQEFGSSAPFLYFADHKPELAAAVEKGRRDFMGQFPSIAAIADQLAAPHDQATFERSKLDHTERREHIEMVALHRDLLRLRREDATFAAQPRVDGAVLGAEAFLLRFAHNGSDRLLLVNLGPDLSLDVAHEPLLAPPLDCRWELLWSSEWPQYGGGGTAPVEVDGEPSWRIPGHAAVVLGAVRYTFA